ncbi:Mor transcription activator family protein [Acinetobacter wuhouensis]|uniref:Transcriptional regulator n=1 Tax=Acinetobacter wuhouensis TaxID=1879050 RepID=A0A3G2T5V4_9GAMM|nr:Mor transcription activator family protein [Acinetobacter wuhouensis]AYO54947.1 transcriptional regulator [Acinetobacter wuhouensis]
MAYRPHITDAQQVFSNDEIIALMPKNFAFVAKLIGVEAALNMIHAYGGTNVFIPHRHALNINHDISGVISLKKLQILSEQLGNNTIEVPMGSPLVNAMRNKMIRNMANDGHSKPKIARKFGVTQRTIRTIVNGEEKLKLNIDRNYDLFEA